MSTINDNQALIDSLGLSRNNDSNSRTTSASDMGSGDFLKLMLTQLQNQDPTNPMDNSEFLSQIAQFSTVTGVQDLNKSFSGLSTALQSNQALQASSLVGRTVLVPGKEGMLTDNVGIAGQIEIPASASNVKVEIYDAHGQLVQTVDLGTQPAGDLTFAWDGNNDSGTALPSGIYTIKASGMVGGKTTAFGTSMYAQVQSVDLGGNQGIRLNLLGLGTVNLTDVEQVM
jgi:flagellar basal-body rod modification protein FlgD